MDFLFKLIEIANTPMTTPTLYGTFHLVWILAAVIATVLMCAFLKNASERGVRLICLAFWLVLVAFEIYKQFKFTHLIVDGVFVFDYNCTNSRSSFAPLRFTFFLLLLFCRTDASAMRLSRFL